MLVKVFGSAVFGVEATTITVEVNIDKGIGYHLVGLPDNAIKESSYRIAAALKNNGYSMVKKDNHQHGSCSCGRKALLMI
jgi:magnesium chelatase family protein